MPFRFSWKVIQALTWKDILILVSKGVFFGMVVAVISCHYGLAVRTGVPQAAINAAVGSMALLWLSAFW